MKHIDPVNCPACGAMIVGLKELVRQDDPSEEIELAVCASCHALLEIKAGLRMERVTYQRLHEALSEESLEMLEHRLGEIGEQ